MPRRMASKNSLTSPHCSNCSRSLAALTSYCSVRPKNYLGFNQGGMQTTHSNIADKQRARDAFTREPFQADLLGGRVALLRGNAGSC
jgi:hypothetical protein